MNNLLNRGAAKVAGLTLVAVMGTALAGCNGSKGGTTSASTGASGDTIATVGSSTVTHADLASFLEAQQGEQVLPYLIDTQLVFEALKDKGLDVTDAEVQDDLTRRQANDPSLTKVVSAGGPKLDGIKLQIKRELGIEKLETNDIKATDDQVKAFFTKNHAYYDAPTKLKVGVLFASSKARADLLSRELAQKTKSFEALVIEQKNAKDPIANQSMATRDDFATIDNFGPTLGPVLAKLKKGDNTPPQPIKTGLPEPIFLIFHVVDIQPGKKGDLTTLKPQIEMDYKLAQVALKTVKINPKNPPFDETVKRTQDFLHSQNPSGAVPTLRDVLNYINQTTSTALVAGLRGKGKVTVSDPTYTQVAEQYQATGGPAGALGGPAGGPTGGAAPAGAAAGNTAPADAAGNAAPAPGTATNSAPSKP